MRRTVVGSSVVTVALRGRLLEQTPLAEAVPGAEVHHLPPVTVDHDPAVGNRKERVRGRALDDDVDPGWQRTQLGRRGELLAHEQRGRRR